MNIFRRFFSPGKSETKPSATVEESTPPAQLEVGSSSMHQPDPGAGTLQSSKRARASDGDYVIEILSSDDEGVASTGNDNDGKENVEATSSITNIPDTGNSKATEDAIKGSAKLTSVPDPKPTASPLSRKSLSITITDTSNGSDEDGDEGKENTSSVQLIDNTSNAVGLKAAPDPATSMPNPTKTMDLQLKESPRESPKANSATANSTRNLFSARKRRRKQGKDSSAVLPSVLLSEKSLHSPNKMDELNFPTSQSSKANKSVENDPFAFPGKAECNSARKEMMHERKITTGRNNLNPSPNTSDLFENAKRQNHTDISAVIRPNKRQRLDDHSGFQKLTGEPLAKDIVSDQKAKQVEEVQSPSNGGEPMVESPTKAIPMLKLPPELAPFNNPGVCDYGVIRTSRLRNRKKKSNVQEDVLYQNIQGQRRCRATRDGRIMTGNRNSNRCLNCAEGVFKYCHTHRDLDEDQKAFWIQRERRDKTTYPSASATMKEPIQVKSETAVKANAISKIKAGSHILETKGSKGHNSPVDTDMDGFEKNDTKRCVFLLQSNERCSRKILNGQPGFCYAHAESAKAMKSKRDEIYRHTVGTMRCAAVSKVGSNCKFKAFDQCVFCIKHINLSPENVSRIVFDGERKINKSREKGGNGIDDAKSTENVDSVKDPLRTSSISKEQIQGPEPFDENNSVPKVISKQLKDQISNPRRIPDPSTDYTGNAAKRENDASKLSSHNSIAESDQVPKNIEFPTKIEFSKKQIEMATSFDNMCFNVYKSKRCWFKRSEGCIQCCQCRQCNDEGKPFDHILNNDEQRDEGILLSSQCINFNGKKQCENLSIGGKILCIECLQSRDQSKRSTSEHSQNSDASETEMESDGKDTDSSSPDTFSSESEDSEDSCVSDETNYDAYCKAYTHKEFFKMWKNWEKKTEKMDDVEDSRLIKRANNTMSPRDTCGQVKAQYGRVLPQAMKKMIKILELRREDVFLDIGHGVGNTCLHASFCIGCESRGIEVVTDRHEIADKFRSGMFAEHNSGDAPRPELGKVDLRLGRLEDPNQKEFLTKGVTRAYVNNFNGVFAERSSKNKDKWFLDDYISGIFASMAPGAIMVTFHPLNLGMDRDSVNSLRSKHNLAESDHASYYDSEKILLGQAFYSVKWNKRSGNTNNIYVYKYRRLHQPCHHNAVFLCSNPSCKMATDMVPIPATTQNEDGRCVINHCKCKFSPKNLRKRSTKQG